MAASRCSREPGGGRKRETWRERWRKGEREESVEDGSEKEKQKRRKAGETRKVARQRSGRGDSSVEGGRGGRDRGLVGAGGRRGKRTLRCVIASGASAHRRGID